MSSEKSPLLLAEQELGFSDKSAKAGIRHVRHSRRSARAKNSSDDEPGFLMQVIMPVVLTLAILCLVLLLPFFIELYNVATFSGNVDLGRFFKAPEFSDAWLKEILLTTPSNDSAAEWLRYYTAGPHLAGKNYSQAAWTRDRWEEWGADASIVAYDLYINYPVDHSLSLLTPAEKGAEGALSVDAEAVPSDIKWQISYEASLEEDVLPEDWTTGLNSRVPTFHGYSASGNVTGPVVYVNYGTFQDYADLEAANISLKGAVALARYGGIFRGLKVKRAQELGAVGVLLFSEPGDDGPVTVENGYESYPDGPARQPSSVQRGSVQFLSVAPGDPTTPGYPSKPGVPRGNPDKYIPSIPSVPISYVDALPLLKALNGHGPTAKDLGAAWTTNLGLDKQGVKYNIGPTPSDSAIVNLYNEQDYTITPIWDTIGIFNGSTLPNEVVVVGNHRDAWIAGGAVDPNSGSAVLNEVVRSFGAAVAAGWKPLRTIVFASWDGEEYGLLGSTEWVEEYLPWLDHVNLAYVNIDVGVSGPNFHSSAVPLLHDLIYNVTGEILSPDQSVPGQTIRDTWSGKIGPLGSGSDYTAFLDHAGIASIDIGFGGGAEDPVYHYHSNYDSYYWMEQFGDPGFTYHQTQAQILGLLTARLATDVVVPFRAADYADKLQIYVNQIRKQLAQHEKEEKEREDKYEITEAAWAALSEEDQMRRRARRTESACSRRHREKSAAARAETQTKKGSFVKALDRLDKAVAKLAEPAAALDAKAEELRSEVSEWDHPTSLPPSAKSGSFFAKLVPGWWKNLLDRVRRVFTAFQILGVNRRYQFLERKFLYEDGLDDREWFKHVIYAPGVWTGYAGAVFPGLVESIDAGNWTNAVRWADIIEERILKAAKSL